MAERLHLLLFIPAILLIILSFWLYDLLTGKQFGITEEQQAKINYYLTNFSIINTDAGGQIRYQLSGSHYAYRETIQEGHVIKPLMQKPEGESAMILRAEEARIFQVEKRIQLIDNVRAEQPDSENQLAYSLSSDLLNYEIENQVLYSDQDVRVESETGSFQGTGLRSNLKNEYIEIQSNVNASYTVPISQ